MARDPDLIEYVIPAYPGFFLLRLDEDGDTIYREPVIFWRYSQIGGVIAHSPERDDSNDTYENAVLYPDGSVNTFEQVFRNLGTWRDHVVQQRLKIKEEKT